MTNNKRGMAMVLVLFLALVVGTLSLSFFYRARESKYASYRYHTSESARQLAIAAADEAFMYIYKETANTGSQLFKSLIEKKSDIYNRNNPFDRSGTGIAIPVPATIKSIPQHSPTDINVTARIIDFKNYGSTGQKKYYNNEGVGTLEIYVEVKPKNSSAKCVFFRHHDYKVAAIVAAQPASGKHKSYIGAYPLDYCLYLRQGAKEFEETRGLNLNPATATYLVCDASAGNGKYGKVYFGTKSNDHGKNDLVYLNIGDDTSDLMPEIQTENGFLFRLPDSIMNQILPTYNKMLTEEANHFVKKKGGKSGSANMSNHVGDFSYVRYPMYGDYLSQDNNLFYRDLAFNLNYKTTYSFSNINALCAPGIKIEPKDALDKIIEGDVRQRFFHFGRLNVNLSNAIVDITVKYKALFKTKKESRKINVSGSQEGKKAAEASSKKFYPVYIQKDAENYRNRLSSTDPSKAHKFNEFLSFINYSNSTVQNKQKSEPRSLSFIDIAYPYRKIKKETDTQFSSGFVPKMPALYNYSNPGICRDPLDVTSPYAHVNLWHRRQLSMDQLKEIGIFDPDKGELRLRGIIEMKNNLVLKSTSGAPIKFKGAGVIIAPQIEIKSGLVSSNEHTGDTPNICVLQTNSGYIYVDTTSRVDASLIAVSSLANFSRKCGVIAKKPMNINGSLAADYLCTPRWCKGDHKIKYNNALHRDKDLYQINISRWITFERFMENDHTI